MNNIGVLVDLDMCVGCYACQSACNNLWNLPLGQTYLKAFNGSKQPEMVDGDLRAIIQPIPLALERCAECVDREGEAPCAKICIAKALWIDDADKLAGIAASMGRRNCLYR